MTKLVCEACGYKMEKEKVPFRCPYCSKEGTLVKEKSAQDLLDDVSKNPDEFE